MLAYTFKNTFDWDSNVYKQKQGTDIGTRSAPKFAGLYMGDLEVNLLDQYASFGPYCSPQD